MLESYDYLGLGIIVKRGHAQPGVDLTYVKQSGENNGDAGDQYIGLDRFGRVADQRWRASANDKDRFQYGHDRDSNRLYRDNTLDNNFDELYHANGVSNGYDGLNQLTAFRRGALSDANSDGIPDTVTTASRTQTWDFDALGNFDGQNSDGTNQTRSHNKQNEITSISSATTPTYDANGNMTGDENGKTLVYDAWNRLVAFKNGSTTLISYKYDAINRRVQQTASSVTTDFYLSDQWQVLEERISGAAKVQYVWSPVYVDAMVLRDRDATGDSALEERLWVMHDANFNVTGFLDNSGNVVERFAYDPYGSPSYFDASWGTRSASSYAWLHLHQGGRWESVSGLYHFRNRDLSPTLGRWNRNDPIGFGGGDIVLYRGLGNSFVNQLDDNGLASKLNITSVLDPLLGTYGAFFWPIKWSVTPKPADGSVVVQKVEVSWNIDAQLINNRKETFASGKPGTLAFTGTNLPVLAGRARVWWEAWKVESGASGPVDTTIPWEKFPAPKAAYSKDGIDVPSAAAHDWFFMFNPLRSGSSYRLLREKSEGWVQIEGKAFFLECSFGILKKWNFKPIPRITGAGGLPSILGDAPVTADFEKWLRAYNEKSKEVTRRIKVNWKLDGKTRIEEAIIKEKDS